MSRRLTFAVLAAGVLAALVVTTWYLRRPTQHAGAVRGTTPEAGEAVAPTSPRATSLANASPPSLSAAPSAARTQTLAERRADVRQRVQEVLDAHDVADARVDVSCASGLCRIELAYDDPHKIAEAFERLQDTAFVGYAQGVRLVMPEDPPQGGGARPFRVTLELSFP